MWLGIAIVLEVLWAVGALNSLGLLPKDISKYFADPGWRVRGFAWIGIAIAIAILLSGEYKTIWSGLWPELLGIGVGVLGIDELNRQRSEREYKRNIIRQMASFSNGFALEAARIALDEEWLQDGTFVGAHLWKADLTGADLMEANLTGADLRGAILTGALLRGAILTGALLSEAILTGADLWKAELTGADLSGANLAGVKFWGANLEGALLWRANLAGENLLKTDLRGALYDNTTQWPGDFDPKVKGAVDSDEMSKEEWELWQKKYRPKKK